MENIDSITGNKIAKVRIAARGDKVINKNSLYSPVAGITGLRLLIHISTNNFNDRLLAIDVKTAFLNARTTLPNITICQ